MATMAPRPVTQPHTLPRLHLRPSSADMSIPQIPILQKDVRGVGMQSDIGTQNNGENLGGLVRQRSRPGRQSRSGTNTPVTSSCYSQASIMLDIPTLSRQTSEVSPDATSLSEVSLADSSNSRQRPSFFSPNRILRRPGSKMSLGASDVGTEEPQKRPSSARRLLSLGLDRNKKDTGRQAEANINIPKPRPIISSPYDFHHVSHTERTRRAARDGDIYASLQHMRTPSKTLKGIKTRNIQSGNFDALPEQDEYPVAAVETETGQTSPQVSPLQSADQSLAASPSASVHGVSGPSERPSHSRSADSFSRPRAPSQSQRMSIAMECPPPRKSSRAALEGRPTNIEDLLKTENLNTEKPLPPPSEEATDKPLPPPAEEALAKPLPPPPAESIASKRFTGVWDFSLGELQQASEDETASDHIASDDAFSHAVTTDAPIAAAPSAPLPLPLPLAAIDVLESVAEHPGKQPASDASEFQGATSPRSSRFPPHPLTLKSATRNPRLMSQMSDLLAPPFSPIGREFPPTPVQSSFSVSQDFEDWENDVDYCYDHAAEAHEDYVWDRKSSDAQRTLPSNADESDRLSDILDLGDGTGYPGILDRRISRATRPHLYVPDVDAVPDLAPRSAHSASTYPSSVRTPSVLSSPVFTDVPAIPDHLQEYLNAQPKYNALREDAYADYVADFIESDRHFSHLDPNRNTASFSHSSAARLSKSSSYDDGSDFTGISSIYSSMRQSGSSIGSLPDLVHSLQARRDKRASAISVSDRIAFFSREDEVDSPHSQMRKTLINNTVTSGSTSSSTSTTVPNSNEENEASDVAFNLVSVPAHELSASESAFNVQSGTTEPHKLRKRFATLNQMQHTSKLSLSQSSPLSTPSPKLTS